MFKRACINPGFFSKQIVTHTFPPDKNYGSLFPFSFQSSKYEAGSISFANNYPGTIPLMHIIKSLTNPHLKRKYIHLFSLEKNTARNQLPLNLFETPALAFFWLREVQKAGR
jgi:hypothetical protein